MHFSWWQSSRRNPYKMSFKFCLWNYFLWAPSFPNVESPLTVDWETDSKLENSFEVVILQVKVGITITWTLPSALLKIAPQYSDLNHTTNVISDYRLFGVLTTSSSISSPTSQESNLFEQVVHEVDSTGWVLAFSLFGNLEVNLEVL